MTARKPLLILFLLALTNCQAEAAGADKPWYTKPAEDSARRISADKARWGSKFSREALHHYKMLFRHFFPNLLSTIQSGTFQIDAHFGFAAVIGEMLLQSHLGEIHLLPCLPDAWPNGSVRGMQARRGFTIDMQWRQSKLDNAVITSHQGNGCKLRTDIPVNVVCNGRAIDVTRLEDGNICFPTQAGKSYVVKPR